MKNETGKSRTNSLASWSIIGVVLAGTLLISGIAEVSEGSSVMAKIFLFFLGAVIVVQVIPGLMLFGSMMKGIFSIVSKKAKVPAEEKK